MMREIRGAKQIQNYHLKIRVRKIRGGGNYASKYGILCECAKVLSGCGQLNWIIDGGTQ